ncbi:MAG: hypothetical protein WCM76_08525 [Bacteroidota bacterium]
MEIYSPRSQPRENIKNEIRTTENSSVNNRPVEQEKPTRTRIIEKRREKQYILPGSGIAEETSILERMGNKFYEVLRGFFDTEKKAVKE